MPSRITWTALGDGNAPPTVREFNSQRTGPSSAKFMKTIMILPPLRNPSQLTCPCCGRIG